MLDSEKLAGAIARSGLEMRYGEGDILHSFVGEK